MTFQQYPELVLIRHLAMMFILIRDLRSHLADVGLADRTGILEKWSSIFRAEDDMQQDVRQGLRHSGSPNWNLAPLGLCGLFNASYPGLVALGYRISPRWGCPAISSLIRTNPASVRLVESTGIALPFSSSGSTTRLDRSLSPARPLKPPVFFHF